ncbi:MAG: glycoside hydrolase family 38 C-terminal domain-containing protein [Kiritimatiellales bacterium]
MSTNKKITGHIISHTHWDREWRTPIWGSKFQLKKMLDVLLNKFETDPEYKAFLFDGQVIAVEDYLELCPEKDPAVRKAVEAGKLFIGPWYNLPDLYPVCGEALIRNLLWGAQKAEALGGCMKIGYTTFGWGQTAQFPQLLAGFGIDFVVAGKNVSKKRAPQSEFIWESPDGTRLITTRLGTAKRNNFFFHLMLPLRYGRMYTDPSWGYRTGEKGFLYHPADPEHCDTEQSQLPDDGYHYEMIKSCLNDLIATGNDTSVPSDLFFGDGTDFSGVTPDLAEVICKLNEASDKVNFVHSTLPEYVAALKARLSPDKLPVVRGELRDGPIASISGNALSVRMNLKTLNRQAQTLLCRYAEPFASLIDSPDAEFHQTLLRKAWEYLLKSHSHDAINGVTHDKTSDDIANRLQQVIELSETVFTASVERVLSRLDLHGEPQDGLFLTLFNPLPQAVCSDLEAVVDVPRERSWKWVQPEELNGALLATQPQDREELTVPVNVRGGRALPWQVDRHRFVFTTGKVPAMGYKTIRLTGGKTFDRTAAFWPQDEDFGSQLTGPNRMANEFIEVAINGDGTLDVTHRETGRVYQQLNFLEYSGDAGDYWQRVEPRNQTVITTLGCSAEIRRTADGPLMTRFEIRHTLDVPAGVDRKTGLLKEKTVSVEIRSTVTLKKNSPALEIETQIDNRASDCRFRVGVPTGIQSAFADTEGHFTVDRRPIALPRDERGIGEAQMTALPMQHWVDLSDGTHGVAVLNRNLQEYEVTEDPSRTLMLTLMRCTAMRICAEYRAPQSDPAQTGAQMHGKTSFSYAIYPHKGDWQSADTYSAAEQFNSSLRLFQHTRPASGDLPPKASYLSLNLPLRLSAVKRAEDRDGLIIRVFNPADKKISGRVVLPIPVHSVATVRLDETVTELCPIEKNDVVFQVAPHQIVTLKCEAGVDAF